MARQTGEKTISLQFASKHTGKWPPDISLLSGAGFDHLSTSKYAVLAKKVEGTSLLGKPSAFTEIELRRDSVMLRYTLLPGSHAQIRQVHACLLLLRTLALVPGISADTQSLSALLIPALEEAAQISNAPYELVSKKYDDFRLDALELAAKNKKAMSIAEESASALAEMEKRNAALQARIAFLESVPDAALRESVLDWVASHRGAFNAAAFSKLSGIPIPRCEEGLSLLLADGAIRKINGSYQPVRPPQLRLFDFPKNGVMQLFEKHFFQKAKGRLQQRLHK